MVRSQRATHAVWKLCPHARARAGGPRGTMSSMQIAQQLGAKWDNDAKKWFADTAEAYYDLEEWHPANPTPGLTAKGRAESLYILSRQLQQEADAILARERAMEQRRLGGKEAKPLPSPCTGKRKAEEPEDRFVTEWTWMKKLDASKPIKDREFVYNSRELTSAHVRKLQWIQGGALHPHISRW